MSSPGSKFKTGKFAVPKLDNKILQPSQAGSLDVGRREIYKTSDSEKEIDSLFKNIQKSAEFLKKTKLFLEVLNRSQLRSFLDNQTLNLESARDQIYQLIECDRNLENLKSTNPKDYSYEQNIDLTDRIDDLTQDKRTYIQRINNDIGRTIASFLTIKKFLSNTKSALESIDMSEDIQSQIFDDIKNEYIAITDQIKGTYLPLLQSPMPDFVDRFYNITSNINKKGNITILIGLFNDIARSTNELRNQIDFLRIDPDFARESYEGIQKRRSEEQTKIFKNKLSIDSLGLDAQYNSDYKDAFGLAFLFLNEVLEEPTLDTNTPTYYLNSVLNKAYAIQDAEMRRKVVDILNFSTKKTNEFILPYILMYKSIDKAPKKEGGAYNKSAEYLKSTLRNYISDFFTESEVYGYMGAGVLSGASPESFKGDSKESYYNLPKIEVSDPLGIGEPKYFSINSEVPKIYKEQAENFVNITDMTSGGFDYYLDDLINEDSINDLLRNSPSKLLTRGDLVLEKLQNTKATKDALDKNEDSSAYDKSPSVITNDDLQKGKELFNKLYEKDFIIPKEAFIADYNLKSYPPRFPEIDEADPLMGSIASEQFHISSRVFPAKVSVGNLAQFIIKNLDGKASNRDYPITYETLTPEAVKLLILYFKSMMRLRIEFRNKIGKEYTRDYGVGKNLGAEIFEYIKSGAKNDYLEKVENDLELEWSRLIDEYANDKKELNTKDFALFLKDYNTSKELEINNALEEERREIKRQEEEARLEEANRKKKELEEKRAREDKLAKLQDEISDQIHQRTLAFTQGTKTNVQESPKIEKAKVNSENIISILNATINELTENGRNNRMFLYGITPEESLREMIKFLETAWVPTTHLSDAMNKLADSIDNISGNIKKYNVTPYDLRNLKFKLKEKAGKKTSFFQKTSSLFKGIFGR